MAIFNEILSGRYNRALQKIFAIKGTPPVRQLGGEIMPVHNLKSGVENRFTESWRRYIIQVSQAGAVGNVASIRFRNPKASSMVAVFERIRVLGEAAADKPFLTQAAGVSDGTLVALPRTIQDLREDPQAVQQSNLVISSSAVLVISGNTVWQANTAVLIDVEAIQKEDDQIVLSPNDSLTLFSSNLNTVLSGIFLWRERHLEESELV